MPEENHTIVAGLVIAMIVLLIAASFIFMLVTYANNRKKKFFEEKKLLQQVFSEQLLQSKLEMQEHTFNSISREIHDNVGQVLSLAKVQVNIMEREVNASAMLADLKDNLSKAMLDLRDIAKGLNSDRIKLCGLAELTNHELQRISRVGSMHTSLFTEGTEQNPSDQKKLIIFRIIQESLQNILKHAEARSIRVSFYYEQDRLRCEIKDDGIGFDPALANGKESLGLQNMISRATLIGGNVTISSQMNQGTIITINSSYD